MRHYIGVVHQDENSSYGVHFPDVPGCFSASDTMDELVSLASEALSLHLEDADLPEARTLDKVRSDEDVAKDLREGAVLIAIPFFEANADTTAASITMDVGLLMQIDETAKERGLTRSSFLEYLARRELTG